MAINTEKTPWETPAGQTTPRSEFDGQAVPSIPADPMAARRELAIKRIKAKNDFIVHLLIYLAINGMLVFTWAFTGAGFFWPIFPIVGWGIGVIAHDYQVYWGDSYSEERIRREMETLS